ncbi:hypothetical protein K501DRAFT_63902 [Backusella circina FSU 941]|nr:hypothetical protein K501DRAFT_63902 [Backusella circina FSU 941]
MVYEEEERAFISNLPNECMHSIFLHCDDLKTKCIIARVCRRWRLLMLDNTNWKKATTSLVDFQRYMTKHKSWKLSRYLQQLTTLHIRDLISTTNIFSPSMIPPKIIPFLQLSSLKLDHLFYSDLLHIIEWLGPITKRLECRNIRLGSHRNVCLTNFRKMPLLRVLILEFQSRCAHTQPRVFNLTGRPVNIGRHFFKLKVLSFLNYYDTEEYSAPDMDGWHEMERVMHSKYSLFTIMKDLRSLSLNRCNAFTSSVWRGCLLPCAPNLRLLSLTGWEGRGYRQSPMEMALREQRAGLMDLTLVPDEVELALAEFISCLASIKCIQLDGFQCGYGLVLGLERLGKEYRLSEGGTIGSFMDTRLNQFRITFI